MPMSWKPQVKVDGNWNGNGLRFATKEEAESRAADLFGRWHLCTGHRAVESDEPVQNRLEDGELIFLVDEAQGDEPQQEDVGKEVAETCRAIGLNVIELG